MAARSGRNSRPPRLLSAAIFGAAAPALPVAFSLELASPYWAATTVYIVAQQPSLGALRSRALWRLAGAAFAVLAVPTT